MKFLAAASWVSVLLIFTFICMLQQASAQPGFLSIDCGAPGPYVDEKGISWVSDAAYISLGSIASVSLDPSLLSLQGSTDLTTLRYFPDTTRRRYCYILPAKIGQTYLMRMSFYHGGYDSQPSLTFNVSADFFASVSVTFTPSGNHVAGEGIIRAAHDNIQFCLIRTLSADNPFISSLELRPLDNTMYSTMQDGSSLFVQFRSNYGAPGGSIVRYPDDPYDRFWRGVTSGSLSNVTSSSVLDSGFAVDKPPTAVMNTALVAINDSMQLTFTPFFHNNSFLLNVYLAELQTLTANQTRVFDIAIGGVVWVPNVNVYINATNRMYKPIEFTTNTSKLSASGALNVSFGRSTTSPLGPIVNAVELFSIVRNQARTLAADVSAIEGVKKSFGLVSWTGDPCLLVPYDWLNCTTSSPPRVTTVKLSYSNLTGPIPSALRDLTNLTSLHLDNNKLTGPIPDWLVSLPNLRELYLQNNGLSGSVPKSLLTNSLLNLQVDGNPDLCVNATCPTGRKSSNVGVIVGVVVGVLAIVAAAVGVTMYCLCTGKKKGRDESSPINDTEWDDGTRGSRYTLAQVKAATNDFAKILGKGGFGPVYYGKLASGQEVAVKVAAKGSGQGSKEFINEVELLTRVHHKNLVSLVGYCNEGDNLILLYEFMPMGTLQEHLYRVGNKEREFFLDWKTRLQIAVNAAQGLEYLHVGCSPAIFHRDIKSNNILLGSKLIAKVADFGLSKSTNSNENVTHVSTMVKGTIGYLDPEYFITNQLTDKSDVYGFGIVLLELICARPPFLPSLPEDQRRIDQWVRPHMHAGNIEMIVDPSLAGHYNVGCMWKVADLAMASVEPRAVHRPKMSAIVQELRDALQMEKASNPSSAGSNPPAGPAPTQYFGFDTSNVQSSRSASSLMPR